ERSEGLADDDDRAVEIARGRDDRVGVGARPRLGVLEREWRRDGLVPAPVERIDRPPPHARLYAGARDPYEKRLTVGRGVVHVESMNPAPPFRQRLAVGRRRVCRDPTLALTGARGLPRPRVGGREALAPARVARRPPELALRLRVRGAAGLGRHHYDRL